MNSEEYDVLVCGTGMAQCLLGAALAMQGYKILIVDTNNYYGGELMTSNLTQFWMRQKTMDPRPEHWGKDRDWNLDSICKLIQQGGDMGKLLTFVNVDRYLDFAEVRNDITHTFSLVDEAQAAKIKEFAQKYLSFNPQLIQFFKSLVQTQPEENTHLEELIQHSKSQQQQQVQLQPPEEQVKEDEELKKSFYDYAIEKGWTDVSIQLVLSILASGNKDQILQMPTSQVVQQFKDLIAKPNHFSRYGQTGIVEGCVRVIAVYGGTVMLGIDKYAISEEQTLEVGGEKVKFKKLVFDAGIAGQINLANMIQDEYKIIRCIVIVQGCLRYGKEQLTIKIPGFKYGKVHDIYLTQLSSEGQICPKDFYVHYISTRMETQNARAEIQPALDLIGPKTANFITIDTYKVPNPNIGKEHITILPTLNESLVFDDDIIQPIKAAYLRITGLELKL